jgi:hypothetical protein
MYIYIFLYIYIYLYIYIFIYSRYGVFGNIDIFAEPPSSRGCVNYLSKVISQEKKVSDFFDARSTPFTVSKVFRLAAF